MADSKLNTGLTAAQVLQAFDRALHDMTDAEIRSALQAEADQREHDFNTALNGISALTALLIGQYVKMETFAALEQRVAALEGGGSDE